MISAIIGNIIGNPRCRPLSATVLTLTTVDFLPDLTRSQLGKASRLVGELDAFKGHWRRVAEIRTERLAQLRQVSTIESTASSTRIEGAELSDMEVAKVLEGLKVDSFRRCTHKGSEHVPRGRGFSGCSLSPRAATICSPSRPHHLANAGADRGTHVRVRSTSRRADAEPTQKLRRLIPGETFDEQPMPDADSEAIDFRAASESFASVRTLHRRDLATLRLTSNHQGRLVPTIGGMLLSCCERERWLPDDCSYAEWYKQGQG